MAGVVVAGVRVRAASPSDLKLAFQEGRALAVKAAVGFGFKRVIFERYDEAKGRFSPVYLGTPSIPSWAKELLITVSVGPRAASDVAVIVTATNETSWGGRPVVQLKAPAEAFRGRQLFGAIKPHRGVTSVPVAVLVFAR